MPAKPTLKNQILELMSTANDDDIQFEYGALPWPAAQFAELCKRSVTQVSKCLRLMETDGFVLSEVIQWDTYNAIKCAHAPRLTKCYWPVEGLAEAKAFAKKWNDARYFRSSTALRDLIG